MVKLTEVQTRQIDVQPALSAESAPPDSNNQNTHLSRNETRQIVTPYAFFVADDLLGTPLAGPFRRGFGMLIDLIFVSLLTQVSGWILAAVAAWTFFKAGNRLKVKKRFNGARIILRMLVAVMLFVVVIGVVEEFNHESPENYDSVDMVINYEPEAEEIEQTAQTRVSDNPEDSDSESESNSKGILNRLENLADELGLGFGWAIFYFSIFTAWWEGQTPGKKLLGMKVIKLDNSPLNLWESFGRYGGYAAGLATGLMGFLQVFWDPNRQAIQDKISETLVINIRKPKIQFSSERVE
ncbi:RDD family protein [uncultured Paraglaciecola sp.]|uniref:RDD family protein n=1 Tax=uncultured Paraglaciecola sp. TaxID=1765024 RepID=UPI00263898C7|nr:RDD family protein [uncultured Paraglaciecola sp.]